MNAAPTKKARVSAKQECPKCVEGSRNKAGHRGMHKKASTKRITQI
jgi:hypothetical protein